jgi:hypothetical protein
VILALRVATLDNSLDLLIRRYVCHAMNAALAHMRILVGPPCCCPMIKSQRQDKVSSHPYPQRKPT